MLYQIYETQRSLMEPFADLAEVAAKLFNNTALPISQFPLAQRVAAAYDLMHRLGKDYEKPVFGITTADVDGVDVAIFERVEIDKPFCELRRFKRFTDDAARLLALAAERRVVGLVLGLPLNMNGTEGPRAQSTRAFARNLARLTELPIGLWDERLSTAAVTRRTRNVPSLATAMYSGSRLVPTAAFGPKMRMRGSSPAASKPKRAVRTWAWLSFRMFLGRSMMLTEPSGSMV